LQSQYDWWWKHNEVGDALFGGGTWAWTTCPRRWRRRPIRRLDGLLRARHGAHRDRVRDTAAAERYWTDRGRIQTAINDKMWDAQSGFYLRPERRTALFVPSMSYSG
jgi:hypothetical protein